MAYVILAKVKTPIVDSKSIASEMNLIIVWFIKPLSNMVKIILLLRF